MAQSGGVDDRGSAAEADGPLSPTDAEPPPTAEAMLDELVAEHAPSCYRVALSVVRDPALAEDVVQEALVKAWMGFDSYRGEAPVRHWVLRITHNTAVSVLRRRRDEPVADIAKLEHAPTSGRHHVEREVLGRLAADRLWAVLADLDDVTRAVVVLREVEGMTYEEVAATVGLSLPTVKTRLFRARRMMADRLEEWRP